MPSPIVLLAIVCSMLTCVYQATAQECTARLFFDTTSLASYPMTPKDYCLRLDSRSSLESAGPNVSLEWHMGDGVTKQGTNFSYCYAQPGQYTISLIAKQTVGSTVFRDTSTYEVAIDQIVSFTSRTQAQQSTTYPTYFDAGSSFLKVDYPIDHYYWQFDTLGQACGQPSFYNFEYAGTYAIRLCIEGHNGTDTVAICGHKNVVIR